MRVVVTPILLKGKVADVFALLQAICVENPHKTIKELWLEGRRN